MWPECEAKSAALLHDAHHRAPRLSDLSPDLPHEQRSDHRQELRRPSRMPSGPPARPTHEASTLDRTSDHPWTDTTGCERYLDTAPPHTHTHPTPGRPAQRATFSCAAASLKGWCAPPRTPSTLTACESPLSARPPPCRKRRRRPLQHTLKRIPACTCRHPHPHTFTRTHMSAKTLEHRTSLFPERYGQEITLGSQRQPIRPGTTRAY